MALINYVSPIDPHVHLRGNEYLYDNFLEMGFEDAKAVGLCAVLEQPNPRPNLTSHETIEDRKKQVEKLKGDIYHGVHIGLTNSEKQVRWAFSAASKRLAGSNSVKVFWVHSTGNMGILDPEYQRKIWEIASEGNFKGVVIQHLEAEDKFWGNFSAAMPATHSLRQNSEAELVQVQRQIKNAYDTNFKGTFYVAHVSNPDTIDFLRKEEDNLPFKIAIEMTPHHALLNWEDYVIHGNRVKMNPPLRSPKMQTQLLERLISGKVDIIGTDHAPHPIERKDDSENPSSGIPGIPFWPRTIEILKAYGMKESGIEAITFLNTNKIFGLGLTERRVTIEYNPELWKKYGFNPFSRIDIATKMNQ